MLSAEFSTLDSTLTDENNNLSEFELNVTCNAQDENNLISQIAEKIRDEFQRAMEVSITCFFRANHKTKMLIH